MSVDVSDFMEAAGFPSNGDPLALMRQLRQYRHLFTQGAHNRFSAAGMRAFKQGIERCPYAPRTRQARDWWDGYRQAARQG